MPLATVPHPRTDPQIGLIGFSQSLQLLLNVGSDRSASDELLNADRCPACVARHELAPLLDGAGACPAPTLAKGIKGDSSVMGASSCDHGLASQEAG